MGAVTPCVFRLVSASTAQTLPASRQAALDAKPGTEVDVVEYPVNKVIIKIHISCLQVRKVAYVVKGFGEPARIVYVQVLQVQLERF